jgi:carboxyl-terminal processing protease
MATDPSSLPDATPAPPAPSDPDQGPSVSRAEITESPIPPGIGGGIAPEAGVAPGAGRGPVAGAPARRPTNAALVAVALIAVLAGSALFVSGWSLGRQTAMTPGTPADEAQAFQPFWDTYRAVTERYAGGAVERKAIIEGAIKGMIAALGDPYSQYLTSEEFKATLRDISGEFEGIGATIGTVDASGQTSTCTTLAPDCRLVIVAPLAGSPAEKAGLKAGDVVDKVDGTSLDGLTLDQARDRVRGPKDTAVRLTIVRDDLPAFDVEVVRAVIVQPEVEARDLADGTVGYIKLSGFSDHASAEFDRVVAEDVKSGRRALIVDLRGNPGGFVTAARDIASQFLTEGTIFWEEDADGNLTETVVEPGGAATDPSIRVVVLVDGGSASASEIVAGALHDRGRATLVGSKTFGKGTIQQWTQLEDDSGGFRLTIAKWLTPDKTWVHGKGIEPDVVVTAAPSGPEDDPALDAALEVLGSKATSWVQPAAA